MNKTLATISTGVLIALAGCAGTKPSIIPDWFINPDKTPFHGVGTQASTNLQLAKEQADFNACQEVAKAISSQYEGEISAYRRQATDGTAKALPEEDAKNVVRAIIDQRIDGCVVQQRSVTQAGDGTYTVFAQAYLDSKGAMEAIRQAQATAKVKAESKAAFEELDKLLEKNRALGK